MPAYNEERSIAKIVLGCKRYVGQVVVDDGSCDSMAGIAESVGAYVVRHERNGGYGAALRTCFKAQSRENDQMIPTVTLTTEAQRHRERKAERPRMVILKSLCFSVVNVCKCSPHV